MAPVELGLGTRLHAEACTEGVVHPGPPLLPLLSLFPNHLLQLLLWCHEQGGGCGSHPQEGIARGWGVVHLAPGPKSPGAKMFSSPWPHLLHMEEFWCFLTCQDNQTGPSSNRKLLLYPLTHSLTIVMKHLWSVSHCSGGTACFHTDL